MSDARYIASPRTTLYRRARAMLLIVIWRHYVLAVYRGPGGLRARVRWRRCIDAGREAQRAAMLRLRQLPAQDAAASAARDVALAAGQRPDPILKLGLDNVPVSGTDRFSLNNDFMTMRRIGIMQEFTRADKRHSRFEKFEREADKADAGKVVIVAAIERNTALAWVVRRYLAKMAAIGLDAYTLDTDIAHHPQIAVLTRQEDIARAEVKLAQANKVADWSVDFTFQQRGPRQE